jgi:hypothetical protein
MFPTPRPSLTAQKVSPRVELVWDPGCPNVDLARAVVREALETVGLPAEWVEREQPLEAAVEARYPSPTILVSGQDVAGRGPGSGAGCSVYRDAEGRALGAPPVSVVVDALRSALSSDAGQ